MKRKFKLGEEVVFCVPKKDKETNKKFGFKATKGEIVHIGFLKLTIKYYVVINNPINDKELIKPGKHQDRYIKKMKWNVNKLEKSI